MIKVEIISGDKDNTRHLYFEARNRDSKDDLADLDLIFQSLIEGTKGPTSKVEYVNSYCVRYSVAIPKKKTEPMPESTPPIKKKYARKNAE